jgi:hypothetical protein
MILKCEECGADFEPGYRDQIYCSDQCAAGQAMTWRAQQQYQSAERKQTTDYHLLRRSDGECIGQVMNQFAAKAAAAPALFNALTALVEAHDQQPAMLTEAEWQAARRALAQAKGKDQ